MTSTLITGGARSGKSHLAQELALKSGGAVLFVATAEASDDEMKRRIEEHRKVRPSTWETLETTTHVGRQVTRNIGKAQTVIIDCITLLISNVFQQNSQQKGSDIDEDLVAREVTAEIEELISCIDQSDASFVIVTNEVGLGLVPAHKVGRLYRDLLGRANQMLAQHANEVYLMVSGVPVKIKPA